MCRIKHAMSHVTYDVARVHLQNFSQISELHKFPIMGWLMLVGSIKLQVSVAKESYKIDGIVQKRPIIKRPSIKETFFAIHVH